MGKSLARLEGLEELATLVLAVLDDLRVGIVAELRAPREETLVGLCDGGALDLADARGVDRVRGSLRHLVAETAGLVADASDSHRLSCAVGKDDLHVLTDKTVLLLLHALVDAGCHLVKLQGAHFGPEGLGGAVDHAGLFLAAAGGDS